MRLPTAKERARLRALADELIPAAGDMPAASTVGVADEELDRVLRARPDLVPALREALAVDEPANEASATTQAALLECMQEQQVTVDGESYELARPFVVLATQNPIEYEGTYPLPEAQLDRFTMRLQIGYPPLPEEARMLTEQTIRAYERVAN